MFKNSTLARPARFASTLGLSALLSVGILAPAFAAPDPNPPTRSQGSDRARRGDTLRGTVERVYSARSFDLRANDGRTYRVNMRVSVGLQTQTNVRVVGDLNGSTFEARLVTVGEFNNDSTDDGYGSYGNNGSYNNGGDGYGNNPGGYSNGDYNNPGGYNNGDGYNPGGNNNPGGYNPGGNNPSDYQGQSVTLRGRVTRFISRTDFEVRDDDDGRVYRVRTNDDLPYSVREGDRIEARGELNGTTIRANSAVEIDGSVVNTGNPDNNGAGTYVSFTGPIISLDLNREEARVRAGNGYTYTIRARRSTLDNFRVGQTVRVQGNWLNERVETTSLTRE